MKKIDFKEIMVEAKNKSLVNVYYMKKWNKFDVHCGCVFIQCRHID